MDLVIRNVRLIDGTGADPLAQVSVEVAGGRISWIGEETGPARPDCPPGGYQRPRADPDPRHDRLPRALHRRRRYG